MIATSNPVSIISQWIENSIRKRGYVTYSLWITERCYLFHMLFHTILDFWTYSGWCPFIICSSLKNYCMPYFFFAAYCCTYLKCVFCLSLFRYRLRWHVDIYIYIKVEVQINNLAMVSLEHWFLFWFIYPRIVIVHYFEITIFIYRQSIFQLNLLWR